MLGKTGNHPLSRGVVARFRAFEAIDRMFETTAKHEDRRKSQQSL